MRENSIYTVTPPDMLLPDNGPCITILSDNKQFISDVEYLYENMFKTIPITLYHPDGVIDANNLAWIVSMMRFSDTVYVDLDNISEVGLISAILHNKKGVIIINKKNKRKNIVRLLNTYPDFYVVESVQQYAEMMLDSLETI
tara:strand:- start:750 stop:1175 length:426 start_codon:yes stop_codon:yes gene_type:complete